MTMEKARERHTYYSIKEVLAGTAFQPPFKNAFEHFYQILIFATTIMEGGTVYRQAVNQAFVDVMTEGKMIDNVVSDQVIASLQTCIPKRWSLITVNPLRATNRLLWSIFLYFKQKQDKTTDATNSMSLSSNADLALETCGFVNDFEDEKTKPVFKASDWTIFLEQKEVSNATTGNIKT